jgi:hypothetical protein
LQALAGPIARQGRRRAVQASTALEGLLRLCAPAMVSPECRLWSCRWLVEDDTADLRRPDRSHYVIDMMPDFVPCGTTRAATLSTFNACKFWGDPPYPDAHRDPALRGDLERRADERIIGHDREAARRRGHGALPAFTFERRPMPKGALARGALRALAHLNLINTW